MATINQALYKRKPDVVVKPIKIMVIDDDEDDFLLISGFINHIQGRSFLIDWCYEHDAALRDMREHGHDLYFVDYKLGAKTGLDILKEAVAADCHQPIVMLTGMGSRKLDIEAMEAGATDYLVKFELATDKLERSIRYAIDRSNSLKSLRESEKKYRAIFEKSKDAVFIADGKFFFKEVNPALTDLLGYGSKQIVRLSIFDMIADESKKILITRLLSENGEVHDLTLELAAKGGDRIHCLLSASLLTDGQAVPYIQGIIHDITDLKKAERAHLQSEKLKSANRLLRILAHEVRNPLTNINIAMDMMESEFSTDGGRQYLDIVRRSSRRINELVSELLDSSRQKELIFENISLRQIIEQTLEMASDRIALKNIQVLATFPKEDSIVKVDPVKIKIALLNIIINAIEAISHEQGKLQVRVEQSKSGYDIFIEDNGCGISEKNMSRLFEPFFTSKKNGLGLGLASSLAILQSHEMNVDVKSRLGKGTSFVINVPKKESV